MAAMLIVAVGCGGGGEEAAEAPTEEAVAYVTVDPAAAATVSGKISFEGTPPKAGRINMSAEPDCAALHDGVVMNEVVSVGEGGGLRNVFVWVKAGLDGKFAPSSETPHLDQKGCIYTPHVLGVRTGQTVRIANSDQTTHNVHPLPKINREWNKSQPPGVSEIERSFPRQELMIPIKCNIHPWMRAYISVVDHPFFAVTGDDGSFELKGLPPGTYTIEALHERLGAQEASVTVGDAESKNVDLTFTAG